MRSCLLSKFFGLPALLGSALISGCGSHSENLAGTPVDCFKIQNGVLTQYENSARCPKDVVIPEGVTKIGKLAFNGCGLTSVVIPVGVTEIEGYAFANNQLTSVMIPEGVVDVGGEAFSRNQLTKISLPQSLTLIRYGVFSSNRLTSVELPAKLAEIHSGAFSGNPLRSVAIPGRSWWNGLGNGAFDEQVELTSR
ncbi:MAG: leucine-rich repeat domain-containing protein [Oligoflexia bacterium]|jgi:hypothetical protein